MRAESMSALAPNEEFLSEALPLSQYDRVLRAALARAYQGAAPTALMAAFRDWQVNLALSPGKQAELVAKAARKWHRLLLYALEAAAARGEACPCCIEPLPQDKRFEHPSWQAWPYNLIYQSFLLTQQWWWNATTGVKGVSSHHEKVVSFMTRQWLDMFSPSNFLLTNPEALGKTVETGGLNLWEGLSHWWRDYSRLAAGRGPEGTEAFAVGENVAITPGKVVLRNDLIELIQYAPATAQVRPEPMLIIPSWIMKYYILDLSPENSLVKYLVERGHTVFMVSWKNPDLRDRDLGMADYLRTGVLAAIDAVKRMQPDRGIHGVGYCLGGTFLAIAAAAMARDRTDGLKSLTLLAAEVDFDEPGELSLFIDEAQLAYLSDLTWEQGYLDGKQMSGAFALLNSKDLVWSRMVRDYLMGGHGKVTDLMAWNADATRMPHRLHSEYLRALYLENALTGGRFLFDGKPVALSDIRAPMFVMATQRDHVSPWHSVYKANLFTDTDVTFCLSSGGHNVGVVNPPAIEPPGLGREGRWYQTGTRREGDRYVDPETWTATTQKHPGSWWPAWEAWIAERSGEPVEPPPYGNPEAGFIPLDDAPGRYVLIP